MDNNFRHTFPPYAEQSLGNGTGEHVAAARDRGPCHVVSVRRKLNRDLLLRCL